MDERECVWCDRAWAVLGLLAGMGIAYIAVDVMTNGLLTKGLAKRAPKLAAVIDLPAAGEGGESGAG